MFQTIPLAFWLISFNRASGGVKAWYIFFRDIYCIIGGPIVKVGVGAVAAGVAWKFKDAIEAYIRLFIV